MGDNYLYSSLISNTNEMDSTKGRSTSMLGSGDPKTNLQRLQHFSRFCLITSILYWLWSLNNTMQMKKGFDLGSVSYAFSGISSFYVYRKSINRLPVSYCGRLVFLLSHLFVVAHYGLGLWFAFHMGKGVIYKHLATYCAVLFLVWTTIVIIGWKLITINMEISPDTPDIEEFKNLYNINDDFSVDTIQDLKSLSRRPSSDILHELPYVSSSAPGSRRPSFQQRF